TNALAQIEAMLDTRDVSGNRTLASSVIKQLAGKLAAEFAGSFVDAKVNGALQKVDPTLNQISTTLAGLRKFVGEARAKLATGSEFQAELNNLIASPPFVAEFNNMVMEVRRDVTNAFGQFNIDYSVSS